MYSITDTEEAIKQIQKMLGLNETGQYNKETEDTVSRHQSDNGLVVSGVVDYETFLSIVKDYRHSREILYANSNLLNPQFPYSKGDYDSNVGYINAIIRDIFTEYRIETKPPQNDYYGLDTVEAVRALRDIFMLDMSDETDEILFNRMIKERNSLKFKNNR